MHIPSPHFQTYRTDLWIINQHLEALLGTPSGASFSLSDVLKGIGELTCRRGTPGDWFRDHKPTHSVLLRNMLLQCVSLSPSGCLHPPVPSPLEALMEVSRMSIGTTISMCMPLPHCFLVKTMILWVQCSALPEHSETTRQKLMENDGE